MVFASLKVTSLTVSTFKYFNLMHMFRNFLEYFWDPLATTNKLMLKLDTVCYRYAEKKLNTVLFVTVMASLSMYSVTEPLGLTLGSQYALETV